MGNGYIDRKAEKQPSEAAASKNCATAFSRYYMQRITIECAEDLDRIRSADDFHDGALPMLVNALQQGAATFSIEDQRRVVTAGGGGKDDDVDEK